jgi:hypothetical protein
MAPTALVRPAGSSDPVRARSRGYGRRRRLPQLDVPGRLPSRPGRPPDGIEPRQVSIQFSLGAPDTPHVLVDGPTESPHRYSDNTLCMWYPDDPRDRRWVPSYGSADLIVRIAAHLIREAWWRQTGEWIGPEVPHGRVDRHNDPTTSNRDDGAPDVP